MFFLQNNLTLKRSQYQNCIIKRPKINRSGVRKIKEGTHQSRSSIKVINQGHILTSRRAKLQEIF